MIILVVVVVVVWISLIAVIGMGVVVARPPTLIIFLSIYLSICFEITHPYYLWLYHLLSIDVHIIQ